MTLKRKQYYLYRPSQQLHIRQKTTTYHIQHLLAHLAFEKGERHPFDIQEITLQMDVRGVLLLKEHFERQL